MRKDKNEARKEEEEEGLEEEEEKKIVIKLRPVYVILGAKIKAETAET